MGSSLRILVAATIAVVPPLAEARPGPREIREPLRFEDDERRAVTVGFGAGALVQRRAAAVGAQGPAERGGLLELRLRQFAFLETPARSGRFLWIVQSEVQVGGVLGYQGVPGGLPGAVAGVLGQAGASAGLASRGPLGAYLKGSLVPAFMLTARMLADGHGGLGEAYLLAPLGLGGGLRIAPRSDVTLLLGPRIDAVFGVQALARAREVVQLAVGAEFSAHAIVGYRAYLALSGGVDRSVAGQAFGGQRMNGRGGLDFIFPWKFDLRLSVFLMYRGMWVEAPPGARPFGPAGVSLVSHVVLVGVGLGG